MPTAILNDGRQIHGGEVRAGDIGIDVGAPQRRSAVNTRSRMVATHAFRSREIGADGRAREPVGNTIDVANATYTNDIGSAVLSGHWKDPDFDPKLRAFYYVRVIEIPTPRWTAYGAKYFGIDMPEGTAMEVTDRAYTSPIWYTP